MFYITIILTFIFAILRFSLPSTGQIHHEDIFKDLAHIFTGFLFGLGFKYNYGYILGIIITIIEVIAFFTKG
jgi:uncharacterized membrane protein YedE/YeeE